MNCALYSAPQAVQSPDECDFYHSLDLPALGTVEGSWDFRGRFDEYTGYHSLANKSVLDVGTATGFFSFEAEKRGAKVVSLDLVDAKQHRRLPFPQNLRQTNPDQWYAERNDRVARVKKSYWLAHREYNSNNKVCYSDIYNIPDDLDAFDVVLVGQILVHLPDVVSAIESVARHCRSTFIVSEGMVDNDDRGFSNFLARYDKPEQDFAFWHHSTGLYIHLLGILGFKLLRKSFGRYTCNADRNEPGLITTLVFERR